jgi:hypothetical protein
VKIIDPTMTLDGFALEQALVSMYCTFAASLTAHGVTSSPKLYTQEIPGLVFDAAVGAGWIEVKGEDQVDWGASSKTVSTKWMLDFLEERGLDGWEPPPPTQYTNYDALRLVQLGEFMVDQLQAKIFFNLLRGIIALHVAEGTEHEERLKTLPSFTSAEEREALLEQYIAERKARGDEVTKTEVAERAGTDYTTLAKWRKGTFSDATAVAQRIALLLRFNERNRPRKYKH